LWEERGEEGKSKGIARLSRDDDDDEERREEGEDPS
jgi:hypothetical protein